MMINTVCDIYLYLLPVLYSVAYGLSFFYGTGLRYQVQTLATPLGVQVAAAWMV